ncbi:RluA family pseudouridine synthase [Clostridiaceae bacterium M8S5]|nr:RluA family pseudouridine synthase [Clostridiaceae bacterium M8S5]
MNQVEIIALEGENGRLDSFLANKLEDVSRSFIQKLIKDGNVKVNNIIKKPRYMVNAGDTIIVELPEPKELEVLPEDIEIDIVYEDDDVAVVYKPQGMVVHPACGHQTGTLVNALLYRLKNLSSINGVIRPGIVHRIDKDTSGLLMIAKNDFAHNELSKQLKEHTITRVYYALVNNNINRETIDIDKPIGRHPVDRMRMAVTDRNSKRAVTHITVIERFKNYTLVKAQLETGRTHQIRVHMAYLSHSIVGDPVYGSKKQKFKLEGQLLHAKVLGFNHPRTGEYMEFECDLPDYFKHVLDILRKKNA